MLPGEEHVRGTGLPPLPQILPRRNHIFLRRDGVRVEDQLMAFEQPCAEVEVLVAVGAAASELRIEAADLFKDRPSDRKMAGQDVEGRNASIPRQTCCTIVGPASRGGRKEGLRRAVV